MTKISEPIIELQVAVVSTLRNYLIFPKYAFLISVLITSLSLAKMSVILITYITDTKPDIGLLNAALIVNFEEGFTGVMILALSHIATAYSGPFKMVLLSTVAYVIGLVLLWHKLNFYVAVLLIAVGKAGVKPLLEEFHAAQLRNRYKSINGDEDQVVARTNFWWGFWWFLGSLLAIFWMGRVNWKQAFEIIAIFVGVALVIFMAGFTFYQHETPIGSPLTTICRVMKVAISKRHLPYPDDINAYFMNDNNGVQSLLESRFLRWLDKAAIIRTGVSPQEQERNGELCRATDVNEVKLLLRTIPMWATFCVYCLISATGSTFFFEQATNLNDRIGNNFKVPSAFFMLVQSFSNHAISYLYSLIIKKWWPNHVRRTQLRFILGMLCSLCCCIAARFVEVQRLKLVTLYGYLDYNDGIIPMSVFRLTPQFCFLGLADGLVEDGCEEFFYDQVGESMKRYGPVFRESVLGIGKFISIFWILIFSSWFGPTMNHSHLDNYYAILAILVMGNLYFFGCVSNRYIFKGAGGQLEANSETIPQITLDLFST